MARKSKGKGKAKADQQPKPQNIRQEPKHLDQETPDLAQGSEDSQIAAALLESIRDTHDRAPGSAASSSRAGPSNAPASTSTGPSRFVPHPDEPSDGLSGAMDNLSVADPSTPRDGVPITLPTNTLLASTGSITGIGSTAQTGTSSGVQRIPIRDALPIDLVIPKTSTLQAPNRGGENQRGTSHQTEVTVYRPVHNFGPVGDVTVQLRKLPVKLEYPVRTSLRQNQNQNHRVVTNHFEVVVDKNTRFYEYQIGGIPDGAKRNFRKRLMMTAIEDVAFLHQHKSEFASDYFDTIISWVALHDSATGPKVQSRDINIQGSHDEWRLVDVVDGDDTVSLKLRLKGTVDLNGFQSFVESTHGHANTFDPEPTRKALHIIMMKCIQGPNVFHLNANKFFVKNAFLDLRAQGDQINTLRAIRGYHYKVKAGMGKILLNVTSVTSAFWNTNLVSDVLKNGLNSLDNNESSLKGLQVRIEYSRGEAGRPGKASGDSKIGKTGKIVNVDDQGKGLEDGKVGISTINDEHSRIKRIRGFGKAVSEQKFEWTPKDKDGKPIGKSQLITVENYLWKVYDRKPVHRHLKAVDLGTGSQPSWFAPEDLRILPEQIYARVIPDAVAQTFHNMSCKKPQANRVCIEVEGLGKFQVRTTTPAVNAASPHATPLDGCPPIGLDPNMLHVPCTYLPNAEVRYNKDKTGAWNERSGRWNLNDRKFIRGSPREDLQWKLLCSPGLGGQTSKSFIKFFQQQLVQTGACSAITHIGQPPTLRDTQYMTLESAVKSVHVAKEKPDILVLLLKSKSQDAYASFKHLTDNVYGFQSICATEGNFKPWQGDFSMMQYMANIAMKANLKFNGINHTAVGVNRWLRNTLVLGADLTHPGSGAVDNCPSIAAVVSSTEANGGHFKGQLFLQEKSDMVLDIKSAVQNAIWSWADSNDGNWPENILYYRDGVADSQYQELLDKEVSAVEAAWNACAIEGESIPKLKLTTVICTKRHSTRFFPTKGTDAMANNENCKPGLLVERAVTHPYYSDFYLQSQNAIKGTARPCHYFVLTNGMGITMDQLQDLTHKLCHTYVRATMGVSYAPPAYYADRLCERGRCYLRPWYSPERGDRDSWEVRKNKLRADVVRERKKPDLDQLGTRAKRELESCERDEIRKEVDVRMKREVWKACRDGWEEKPKDEVAKVRREGIRETMYWM